MNIVNYEYWKLRRTRSDLLDRFCKHYNNALNEEYLSKVHSVEFIDSICVIRKEKPGNNVLDSRKFAGDLDVIIPADEGSFGINRVLGQSSNKWSNLDALPDEGYFDLISTISTQDAEIADLKSIILDYESSLSCKYEVTA